MTFQNISANTWRMYRARSSGQPEITTITFTSATTAKVERDGYYDEYQNAHYKMIYTITKQSDSTTTPDTNTTPDNQTITSGDRQGTMSLSTAHSNTITFTNASDSGSLERIPFIISQNADPFYSPENQAYVMRSVKELREGKGSVHELIELEE